jgi:membrane fusion protein, heavy metal efflux system
MIGSGRSMRRFGVDSSWAEFEGAARAARRALGLGIFGLVLGCRSKTLPEASRQPEAAAAVSPALITVDGGLVDSGRIVVLQVKSSLGSAELRLPAEVVPAPDGEAEVGALVSGRLATLLKHEGDQVTKGEILAWIDAPDVGMARAELVRVRAQVNLAEKRLVRARRLAEENAIAASALDEAEADVGVVQAEEGAIVARLTALGATSGGGSRVAVTSPIAGEIVERNVTLGSAVDAGRTLLRIVSRQGLRVRVQYPAALSPLPLPQETLTLERRGAQGQTGQTCSALVAQVSAALEPGSRTVTLYVAPGKNCDFLRPFEPIDALFAQARAAGTTSPNAGSFVVVPRDAIIDVRGLPTVFVAQAKKGTFVARTVSLHAVVGTSALVNSGLSGDESVAIRGTLLLKGEVQREMLGGE